MNHLIEGLLILARLGQQKLDQQPLDLALIATRIFEEILEQEPDREIQFTAADSIPVEADRQLIETLLTNLITNAVKFTRAITQDYRFCHGWFR